MKIIKYCSVFCLVLIFGSFHTAAADTGIDGTATSSSSFTLTGPVYISSLTVNNLSANGNIAFSSTSLYGVVGSTTNDDAATGNVGQYMESVMTTVTTGSTTIGAFTDTGCSITLTPGDWDISGFSMIEIDNASGTNFVGLVAQLAITDGSGVVQTTVAGGFSNASLGVVSETPLFIYLRVTIKSTITYKTRFAVQKTSSSPTYLGVFASSSSAWNLNQIISARRMR